MAFLRCIGQLQRRRYDMSHPCRGRAIIFNHLTFDATMELEPRLGTGKDMLGFSSLLVNYGFKVSCHQDFSLEEIRHEIKTATSEDHTNKDCILIAVFTHGRYGMLAARDQMYNYNILYEAFSPKKCRSLSSKPKIFFIQACQVLGQEAEDNVKSCIPTFPDFLVAYSASPGSSAVRSKSSGTWYMTALHKFLNKFDKGSSIEVMELLIHLNQIVDLKSSEHSTENQMPFIVSTLTGRIQLTKERDEISPSQGITRDGQGDTSKATAEMPVNVVTMIDRQKPLEYEVSPSRLKAIILNHYQFKDNDIGNREGALADVVNLKSSLGKLGFDTQVYQDLTVDDIKTTLETVSQDINDETDCLLVVVSTHGTKSGRLQAADKQYPIYEVWAPFREKNCPALKGKPKIFLINASFTNYVVTELQGADSGENPDFLFAFATVSNRGSMRNTINGSWYIQALCDEIDTNYEGLDCEREAPAFHDILINAQGKIKQRVHSKSFKYKIWRAIKLIDKQTPCFCSTLTKILRFPKASV